MKKMLIYAIIVLMLCSLVLVLPAASAENGKIVFTRNSQIFIMKADGSEQTLISDGIGSDIQSACSPDGKRIAFSSLYRREHDELGDFGLYVMNVDGSEVISLTKDPYYKGKEPSWTPNGAKIAYLGEDSGKDGIYLVKPDETERTFLMDLTYNKITWSPDGTKFAFEDFNEQINVINADGTGQTILSNNEYYDHEPSWSPDGTTIAFTSDRGDNPWEETDIYIMNAIDGSDQTRLTFTDVDSEPSWSPDGTKIVFTSERDGKQEIYKMNADGSDQTRLTTNSGIQSSWCPATNPINTPEFPSAFLPATMIIGFLGAVLLIQRTKEQ